MRYLYLFLSVGLVALSACSPTLSPYTESLQQQYRWSDDQLRQIQFYLSDDLVLRRAFSGSSTEIIRGSVKVVDGQEVEEILIPRATPGVALFRPKTNRLAISFEANGDERFLIFGPNPKAGDRYVLLAKDWGRDRGVVTYEGREYTVSTRSAFTGLMVNLKKIRRIEVQSRTVGGRKVN